MRKTYVCGVGNALIDSEYRVSDNELAKLNLTGLDNSSPVN